MRRTVGTMLAAALLLPGLAQAGEAGDKLVEHLYAGTAAAGLPAATEACDFADQEACFAEGMIKLVMAYEGLAQDLFRYGATTPGTDAAAMLLGMGFMDDGAPAHPNPEQLSYTALCTVLSDFVTDLDEARMSFERAAASGDYVVIIDPLKVRIDFDGNGEPTPEETLGALLGGATAYFDLPAPDGPPPGGKLKTKPQPDTTIGFDRADAIWFAGYMQVTATPFDLILAHDFSDFYNAYLHQVFPRAGLPMEDRKGRGMLFIDPDSDASIADIVAGIHTARFPVTDNERLKGVLERLKAITALSRQNWELILAETDDTRELVPSPRQTSLVPGQTVTDEVVEAWLGTLDQIDRILAGELLLPHWRFSQGFDLKAYFETAEITDVVLLFTGQGALPYLRDGPIADAEAFAKLNEVMGDDWPMFALWFN